jgi:hypothetical protein
MEITKADIEKLCTHVQASFHLCNLAFSEIWYLTQTPTTNDEYEIATRHPFDLYSVSLQYFFIMEYTKLMEVDKGDFKKYISSVSKLNNKIRGFIGENFEINFQNNKLSLNNIEKTSLCIKLKDLRNKKFAHSDDDSINDPFSIKGLSGSELLECKNHLTIIYEIINKCLSVFEYMWLEQIPSIDNRTENFIKFSAVFKKYYFDNYIKAYNEGYGLPNSRKT